MKTKITSLLCAIASIASAQIQKSAGNQLNQRITSVDYLHRGNINNVAVVNTDDLTILVRLLCLLLIKMAIMFGTIF
jgi:hypothetical protein